MASAVAAAASQSHPTDTGEPWTVVVRLDEHFVVEHSEDAAPAHAVFAVQGLDVEPGVVRSDYQGEVVLAPGRVHTVASERAIWRLVPFESGQHRSLWNPDRYHLALVRTDLVTGEQHTQLLDALAASGPPLLRWAGDLNGDGEVDWVIDDGRSTLWLSRQPDGEIASPSPVRVSAEN